MTATEVEPTTTWFVNEHSNTQPTHTLENSSLFIDLIFTLQPNLSVESGTQPSLHPKLSSSDYIYKT